MDITNLHLVISFSLFEDNYALNGGSIYMKNENIIDNDYRLEILNSKFVENKAEVFGGAIYNDIYRFNTLRIKETYFIKNSAYIGGAIYTNFNNISVLNDYINDNKSKFINNISESHGNDYGTRPYKIICTTNSTNEVTVASGDEIPVEFIIYDAFNQKIIDNLKLYSNIAIIGRIEKDIKRDYYYELVNYKCTFHNGRCYFNNLYILTMEFATFNIVFSLEDKNQELIFEEIRITSNTRDCRDNQIKIIDEKNHFFYCENPYCQDICPDNTLQRAECIKPSNDTHVNDKRYNICHCLGGWKGSDCLIADVAIVT
eukprot:jgi/Orpsp1_1/1174923/evm.model.c7180000051977.1